MLLQRLILSPIKIDLYLIKITRIKCLFRWFASNSNRNPYEVLGLKSSCSTQDVKNAYIKLCKELHPDMKPGDSSQHKKFVELNEAYTSLISPHSRIQVDNESSSYNAGVYERSNESNDYSRPYRQYYGGKAGEWYDSKEYKEQFPKQSPRNGFNYKSTGSTLTFCLVLVCFGSLLWYAAYRYGKNYKTNTVDERSRKISESYQDLRKKAKAIGKDEHLENLKKRWSI